MYGVVQQTVLQPVARGSTHAYGVFVRTILPRITSAAKRSSRALRAAATRAGHTLGSWIQHILAWTQAMAQSVEAAVRLHGPWIQRGVIVIGSRILDLAKLAGLRALVCLKAAGAGGL